jgi:hypothetical protein
MKIKPAQRRNLRCKLSGDTFVSRGRIYISTCPADNYATLEELRDGSNDAGQSDEHLNAFVRDPEHHRYQGKLLYVPVTIL